MRMSQNKKFWIGAVVVLLVLFVLSTKSWADPLVMNYTNLSMSCGGSQNLSASGGCPPYNWILFGGGTLTPSGGDNTSATYVAPTSNPNCANNAMIILTDCRRNTAEIQIAVNCNTADADAYVTWVDNVTYYAANCGPNCGYGNGPLYEHIFDAYVYNCDGTLYRTKANALLFRSPVSSPILLSNQVLCAMGINPVGSIKTLATTGWHLATEPSSDGSNCGCTDPHNQGCGLCYVNAGSNGVLDSPAGTAIPGQNDSWDVRTDAQKTSGCCPLNPITGLPFGGEFSNSEAQAKNAGCPSGLCHLFVKNPTNVATGNKYEEALDLTISTPGLPLEFRRSYNNSQIIFNGPLGYGWTHNYDMSLGLVKTSPTKRVRIWDSDGRALYFSEVQQTSTEILFGGESGVKDRLKQVISTGEYFLRRKESNLTYKFDSYGKLLEISDPNGNALTFTYTGGLLTQVSNNFGKSISIQYNVENRISSVTDPKNQSILYKYTNGDLTKVTYPDQNFLRYAYLNHNLTDKYDTNNSLIGHWGYDAYGRVITYYSHLKDGVPQERIDLTYQVGRTLVTRSTGTTIYTTGPPPSLGES